MIQEILDVVVVGAGFSGLSCLHELRKYGFSCKVLEAGGCLGGIWYWNCYPGARVDTEYVYYQFHQEEIGRDFPWTERFPGWAELQEYFAYVDQRHNFSRDVIFNARVSAATFDSSSNVWTVASDTETFRCRQLILCTGFGSKRYVPEFPGMDKFLGECHHTGNWPSDRQVEFKNKRVAVIGTGASGVQVIQTIGPIVDHLTVFQRTPNTALPMRQKNRSDEWTFPGSSDYGSLLEKNFNHHGASGFDVEHTNCVDASPKERTDLYEKLWAYGGFGFWLGIFQDTYVNAEANAPAYEFWRSKTAPRIHDPRKRELLVPEVPIHHFGIKRPSLEQTYYEVFNQDNVDLVDLRTNGIKEFTAQGIRLENGEEVVVDIIVMATGYDSVTGGILNIDIQNGSGQNLRDHWKEGIQTLVGMATNGFPNIFFLYGPQATTAFSNGPTASCIQSDFLVKLLISMRMGKKTRVEPKLAECEKWVAEVRHVWYNSLYPSANSWFQGDNIPGKRREPLNFAGGIPAYRLALAQAAENDFAAFVFQ